MAVTGENSVQLVEFREGVFGYADMSDGFLRLIVIDGDYDSDFFRIGERLLEDGGDFLDVGANFGLLSVGLANELNPRVRFHLFEPNPALLPVIQKNVELIEEMRAIINPVAVGASPGTASFAVDVQQSGASHLSQSGGIEVDVVTLDRYCRQNSIERVALLKLDIEGFELAALEGAQDFLKAKRIQAIYFEYFEKYQTRYGAPRAVLQYLDTLDYEVCYCRNWDLEVQGSEGSHTIRKGLPGHGLPLLPIRGSDLLTQTDLLAIPRDNLVSLAEQS